MPERMGKSDTERPDAARPGEARPGEARPVVITRPLAQADGMARRVTAMGRTAIIFPLLEIHPLADSAPLHAALAQLEDYALVAFVSPNAIGAAFAGRPDWPRQVPLAVMGEGSRQALAQLGLTDANAHIIRPGDARRTDSQTLLAQLDLPALKGRQVLILRGESGRELLADALRAAGVDVVQVAAYRRSAPKLDAARRALLLSLLEAEHDWIITSSEALRYLLDMVRALAGADGVMKMQQQSIIVPHLRIHETAQNLGFVDLTLTASGDEHILAALQSHS
jgi:uroporphyrinogen-III synthase